MNLSTPFLVLLGDFNISDINWNSLSGQSPFSSKFCDVTFDFNLFQLVEEPTHIAGYILDLVLTNVPENISNLIINSEPPHPIPSDHFMITFDFSTSPNSINNSQVQSSIFLKVTIMDFVILFIIQIFCSTICLKTLNLCGPI